MMLYLQIKQYMIAKLMRAFTQLTEKKQSSRKSTQQISQPAVSLNVVCFKEQMWIIR